MTDQYSSFEDLARHERAGEDFQIVSIQRPGPIAILAPHGGGIEPGTSEVARALAEERYSLYLFEGLKPIRANLLHITSTSFDEPGCLKLVHASAWVLTLHGCQGGYAKVFLGGRDFENRGKASVILNKAGFKAEEFNHPFSAEHPANLCNQGRSGKGLQIEISRGLRLKFFQTLDKRHGRQFTTPLFSEFLIALQQIMSTIEQDSIFI